MKIILYIGHHKVGSTALQVYLARNWARLAKTGILYPSVDNRGYALNLRLALGQPQPKHFAGSTHLSEPHSALAYRMISDVSCREIPDHFTPLPSTQDMFTYIRQQIDSLTPHTIILCSEAFSNFGEVHPALVNQLCAQFSDHYPEVEFTIYCALRQPDDYIASWHGQRLKVAETATPLRPDGLNQYLSTIHFNYRTMVASWIARTPNARIILRSYSDILAQGDSVSDFVTQTNLDIPSDLVAAERANSSIALSTFLIMEQAIPNLPHLACVRLATYLRNHASKLCSVPNHDIEVFGKAQRAHMVDKFATTQRYLSEVSGMTAFFQDLEHIRETKPVEDRDATRLLLDAIDPDTIPHPVPRDFITRLKAQF